MRVHGRASISPTNPRALGVCDRCGFLYNHDELQWQYQWTGPRLQNLRILVCEGCLDIPQEQLRMIVPPDPIPIPNPRPARYDAPLVVDSFLGTQGNTPVLGTFSDQDQLITQSGDNLILEIRDVPTPDPDSPVIYSSNSGGQL